jgi:hypothetical protein
VRHRNLPTLCLLLVLTSVGCAKRQQGVEDPIAALMSAADLAWERRAQDGLEAAEAPLQQAYGIAKQRPEVLWRLMRYHHAVGLTESTPRAALFEWAEARALGIECLEAEPTVASAHRSRGWEAALELTTSDQAPCVAWTGLVWSRWIAAFGANAAATDLPTAALFAHQAARESDPSLKMLGAWSEAILMTSAPSWADGDPAAGLLRFEGLIAKNPRNALLHVDRLALSGSLMSDEYRSNARTAIEQLSPSFPEEIAAIARLSAPR